MVVGSGAIASSIDDHAAAARGVRRGRLAVVGPAAGGIGGDGRLGGGTVLRVCGFGPVTQRHGGVGGRLTGGHGCGRCGRRGWDRRCRGRRERSGVRINAGGRSVSHVLGPLCSVGIALLVPAHGVRMPAGWWWCRHDPNATRAVPPDHGFSDRRDRRRSLGFEPLGTEASCDHHRRDEPQTPRQPRRPGSCRPGRLIGPRQPAGPPGRREAAGPPGARLPGRPRPARRPPAGARRWHRPRPLR